MDGEFYADTQEFLARLDARRSEQLQALRAFGEAIAMVARAQMIARFGAGKTIRTTVGDRSIELWQHGATLGGPCVWEHDAGAPRRLREIVGHPEDVAAEAVAAFIEECQR